MPGGRGSNCIDVSSQRGSPVPQSGSESFRRGQETAGPHTPVSRSPCVVVAGSFLAEDGRGSQLLPALPNSEVSAAEARVLAVPRGPLASTCPLFGKTPSVGPATSRAPSVRPAGLTWSLGGEGSWRGSGSWGAVSRGGGRARPSSPGPRVLSTGNGAVFTFCLLGWVGFFFLISFSCIFFFLLFSPLFFSSCVHRSVWCPFGRAGTRQGVFRSL